MNEWMVGWVGTMQTEGQTGRRQGSARVVPKVHSEVWHGKFKLFFQRFWGGSGSGSGLPWADGAKPLIYLMYNKVNQKVTTTGVDNNMHDAFLYSLPTGTYLPNLQWYNLLFCLPPSIPLQP